MGIHLKHFSDMHDSLVLDSGSVCSNSEEGMSIGHIVNPFNDNDHEISQSELPGLGTKKGSFNRQNSFCSTSETSKHTEGTKHGLARSNFDGRMVATGKRGKQFKSIPGNSSTCKLGSTGNLHSRTGIENRHSVQQRVQKNALEKCNTELKKTSSICSKFDVILKDAPLQKRNSNAASLTTLPISNDRRKLKNKIPRKLKRKASPAPKQEILERSLFPTR